VIEIANTSLSDDIGQKRLLYEDLGVAEYWVVDVVNIRIIAFTITSAGEVKELQSLRCCRD
jgi:Uma2 family endonuclease